MAEDADLRERDTKLALTEAIKLATALAYQMELEIELLSRLHNRMNNLATRLKFIVAIGFAGAGASDDDATQ